MKRILQNNAIEAWCAAIEIDNEILKGKATLRYRKQFVSSLHNAVELFVKQRMLDMNDYRVLLIRGEQQMECWKESIIMLII